MSFSFNNLTKKQALDFVQEILYKLSSKELDTLFAHHINEFHNADKHFRNVSEAIKNCQRIS